MPLASLLLVPCLLQALEPAELGFSWPILGSRLERPIELAAVY